PLLDLRGVFLNPAVDGRVVDRDAALAHHLFQIAVADAVAAVPAHRPEHDLTFKMAALEVRHGLAPPTFEPINPGADGFATEPSMASRSPASGSSACARARTTATTMVRMRKRTAGRPWTTTSRFRAVPTGEASASPRPSNPRGRPVPPRRPAQDGEIAHEKSCYNGRHEPRRAQAHDARRIPRMGGAAGTALRIRWRRTLRHDRRIGG